MKCVHCDNIFKNNSILKHHQKTAKYCISLQKKKGDIIQSLYVCKYCKKSLSQKIDLDRHYLICKKKSEDGIREEYTQQVCSLSNKLEEKDTFIKELKIQIQTLQDKLENIAIKAAQRPFEDETTIDIDDTLSESQFTVYDSESEDEKDDYQLTPLEVGKGFTIEHRDEDGYINVTNLCKAGGKQFKAWKRLEKTKAFIQVLSSVVLISTTELIKLGTGSKNIKNSTQGTWVHPQIAINIAQWISPQFDVKVSGWIYEIMMTGKVDITNTTSFKQLQNDNKEQKIKIQYLTKKYVKAQPRVQYEERNVVYILTTKLMKKDRRYILGKAINLTNRLSTYNKSDEHEVVYYASCGDEETMSMVENMVFMYLNEYREQANRERFLLPEKKEIGLFSQIINKSVEFFKK
jgi:hypothetical protein